jgi:PII-like signaling protein
VSDDGLKLTAYFGERDRAGDEFLTDALTAVHARHRLRTSLVLRGAEGFGAKQHLRTDRRLTLSEDLPVVTVAVDERDRIEAALAEVVELPFDGLVTLERARLPTAPARAELPPGETKLTVYLGRHERAGGTPAFAAVVDLLHRHGVAGATVLLGVDGTVRGERRRARFLAGNAAVPVMVVAVGDGGRIAAALPELERLVRDPLVTIERVTVCRRDGAALAPLPAAATTAGAGAWQKLMIYAGEQSRHRGRPLSHGLVRELRRRGAAGATTLRGIWGYHGDHRPHGDTLWQLRRRVPVVTVVVDAPERVRDWFEVVAEQTDETGLVTCETVTPRWSRRPGGDGATGAGPPR